MDVEPRNSAIRVSWSAPNAEQYKYKLRAFLGDGHDVHTNSDNRHCGYFPWTTCLAEYFVT